MRFWLKKQPPQAPTQGDQDSLPALLCDLQAFHPQKRERACYALAKRGPEALPALPILIDRLVDAASQVRLAALRAVVAIGKSAVPSLMKAFLTQSDKRDAIRRAIMAMGDEAFEPVKTCLLQANPNYDGRACESIQEYLNARGLAAASVLVHWLSHADPETVLAARRGLINMGPEVIPALEVGIRYDQVQVTQQIALILGNLGDPGLRYLLRLLGDRKRPINQRAGADGLLVYRERFFGTGHGIIPGKSLTNVPREITRALHALCSTDDRVRESSAWVLGSIGKLGTRQDLERVRSALVFRSIDNDEEQAIKKVIGQALDNLDLPV